MKFPGKRKNTHYFPVGEKKRVSLDKDISAKERVYIAGIEQLLVDVEVNVDDEFLEKYGIHKGQSMVLDDALFEEIYQELSSQGRIVGEFPGGAIGNTLHNYSILSDDTSVMFGTICRNMSVGDSAFKYVCNTCSQVDFSYLKPCDGSMARTMCFVTPDFERTFGIGRGIMNELDESFIPEDVIEGAACLLLTAFLLRDETAPIYAATMKAVEYAKKHNVPVILSMGTSFLVEERREFFLKFIKESVNIVAMNDQEAEALVGVKDPLLACDDILELTDLVLLTVGAEGLYLAGYVDKERARKTKDAIHSKSISEYNKFEYSRAMRKSHCDEPMKIFTHINPYMGGPGRSIKNTNGAGDGALAAVIHDIAANAYHRKAVPSSPKHVAAYLTYSSLHQICKYANRVSYEVLKQNSPRLLRGLPEREGSLEESYWEK